jgi:Domain of unknown function (DUF1993)
MKGEDYLNHFVLPNFYFHLTAAYAILRHSGLDVGKRDFIGAIPGQGRLTRLGVYLRTRQAMSALD